MARALANVPYAAEAVKEAAMAACFGKAIHS